MSDGQSVLSSVHAKTRPGGRLRSWLDRGGVCVDCRARFLETTFDESTCGAARQNHAGSASIPKPDGRCGTRVFQRWPDRRDDYAIGESESRTAGSHRPHLGNALQDAHTPLDQIGRELNAQYVLEGSVRREQNRVRITAQLIQVRDQTHVWAREYDRQLDDLLGLEVDVAQEIAKEVRLTFDARREAGSQQAAQQESVEGYDLYLKGLYFFNKRTPETWKKQFIIFSRQSRRLPRRLERMRVWRRATPFCRRTTINRKRKICRRLGQRQNRQFVSTPTRRKRTPLWPWSFRTMTGTGRSQKRISPGYRTESQRCNCAPLVR